ncbi:MAG: ribose 5-phosphate isomerase A [Sporolactobacillus sp.]
MTATDLKLACAKAALPLIPNHATIGLGGGSTISHLINEIKQSGLDLRIVTPSQTTRENCLKKDLQVLSLQDVSHIAIAFDGCDQVDEHFNALKSGGAIHTKEKLIASMADNYVLLVDETKFVPTLTFDLPVALEVLPDAMSYVRSELIHLGASVEARTSAAKDGYTRSDYGNLIIDASFAEVKNIRTLNTQLSGIRGVIDTSLFVDVVSKVMVTATAGSHLYSKS